MNSDLITTSEKHPVDRGFHYSCFNDYPEVWDKHCGNGCLAISATHMLTIIMRKKLNERWLQLSPNALLAHVGPKGLPIYSFEAVITQYGLEERNYNEPLNQVVHDFKYSLVGRRFKVMYFKKVTGFYNIIEALKDNFGPGGRKYPVLALCYNMGTFKIPQVASETTMEEPYRWGAYNTHDDHWANIVNKGLQPAVIQHAMLITGLYTMVDNPRLLDYAIEIKKTPTDRNGSEWSCLGDW